jgi:DNA replication protein DnaD
MSLLARLGLVQITDEQNDNTHAVPKNISSRAEFSRQSDMQPPDLSDEDIRAQAVDEMKQELESGSVFSLLVEETQRSLGKILTPDELLRLFGIYDNLRMEPEVILHLVTHCITESRGRSNGRMPSIRYIEKAAYTWEREGIVTLDCAERYLKELETRRSARGKIKDSLQIRNRELSESEKRYVDGWIDMNFGPDAVEIAYDRTVMQTGKLAWRYMDKIISSWYDKGLHTADEIIKKDSLNDKRSNLQKKPSGQKFNSSDLEEVARMRRMLGKED